LSFPSNFSVARDSYEAIVACPAAVGHLVGARPQVIAAALATAVITQGIDDVPVG
jgi:hypothetical protein